MLQVDNITFEYEKKKPILQNISLEISQGEHVALVGPNGCGKTTLIKIICDLLEIQGGTVCFNKLSHGSLEVKKEIVYLPSNDDLPEFLTGREFIKFVSGLYDKYDYTNKDIENYARYYSMENHLDRLIEDYSHGMKKKIQLIYAFIVSPKLLIIDETLNGIDIEAKEITKLFFERYTNNGGIIFHSSHDLALISEISQRALLMYRGKIYKDLIMSDINVVDDKTLEDMFREIINYKDVRDEIFKGN